MPKEQRRRFDIDPEHLMDYLTEEDADTFLPDSVFSDPEKVGPIEKIVVPKRGGIDVYVKGLKYPFSGYPHRPMVKSACIIKSISKILMEFFTSLVSKKGIIKLIFLRKNIEELIPKLIILFSFIVDDQRLKERYYSHAAREIYRVFNIMIEREEAEPMKDKWRRVRDIVCLVIQFDSAYGYRLQDFLSELNIKKIKLTKRDLFFIARQDHGYRFGGKKRRKKRNEKANQK